MRATSVAPPTASCRSTMGPGLLLDRRNVGSEHVEYTNFGGLPEGK